MQTKAQVVQIDAVGVGCWRGVCSTWDRGQRICCNMHVYMYVYRICSDKRTLFEVEQKSRMCSSEYKMCRYALIKNSDDAGSAVGLGY